RVVDEDGNGIEGVTVNTSDWVPPASDRHRLPRQAKTDAAGNFTLTHLPAGGASFEIYYTKKGYTYVFKQGFTPQDNPEPFVLRKPRTIAGVVLDDATGAPVKPYTLITGWADDGEHGPVFDDYDKTTIKSPDGKFTRKLEHAGDSVPVRIIADGYI